jgi:hypothetical protein
MADPGLSLPSPDSFAAQARTAVEERRSEAQAASASLAASHPRNEDVAPDGDTPAADDTAIAIAHLRDKAEFQRKIQTPEGIKWGRIGFLLAEKAPAHAQRTNSAKDWGFGLVKEALDRLYPGNWESVPRPEPGSTTDTRKWVMLKEHAPKPESEVDEPQSDALFDAELTGEDPPF